MEPFVAEGFQGGPYLYNLHFTNCRLGRSRRYADERGIPKFDIVLIPGELRRISFIVRIVNLLCTSLYPA